jgi:hypothetical protein
MLKGTIQTNIMTTNASEEIFPLSPLLFIKSGQIPQKIPTKTEFIISFCILFSFSNKILHL